MSISQRNHTPGVFHAWDQTDAMDGAPAPTPPPPDVVVFDTTGESITNGYTLDPGNTEGQSFTTDVNPSQLTDVQLLLSDPSASDSGTVTVTLWSDTGGAGPGSPIAVLGTVLDSTINTAGTNLFDFPVLDGPLLDASTRYWIETSNSSSGSEVWQAGAPSGTESGSEFNDIQGTVGSDIGTGVAFGMAVSTEQVNPVTLYDSTADNFTSDASLVQGNLWGQSFSTDASPSTLTDVQLELDDTTSGDGGTLTVSLWSDNGGPGPGSEIAVLGTINDSSLSAGYTAIDLPVTGGPSLDAGTRYWVEVSGDANANANWGITNDSTGTEVSSEYIDLNGSVSSQVNSGDALGLQVNVAEQACYAAGTRILTDRGEVAVQALRPGDRVVALRRGGLATISWIGHRDVELRDHPAAHNVNPVRIMANAIGPNLPHRDLLLSPDHALFLDGALIAARYLVNGASIVQESPDRITYYHVELDAHDVLLAEGLAAESFLDVGNRPAFQNGGAPVMLHPDFGRAIWAAKACAPTHEAPAARAALHRRLLDRAISLGHATTEEPGLHLLANGQRIVPNITGQVARFALPADAGRVQIMSRSIIPSQIALPSDDGRRLGIGVTSITLDDRDIPRDDALLAAGWHPAEPMLRWTDGAAWLDTAGARSLTLCLHPGLSYWADVADSALRLAA